MFRINDRSEEQLELFSKTSYWSETMFKIVDKSWVGYFYDKVFPMIDERPFAVLYSDDNASRPNDAVNVIIALIIIKSILGITDDEAYQAVLFDTRLQYATHLTNDEKIRISKNTISDFKARVRKYEEETGINLLDNELRRLNDLILELHHVDKSVLRRDSMMISDACKNLSRVELVYTVNFNLLRFLSKQNIEILEEYQCYLSDSHRNEVIYRTKDDESSNRLTTLLTTSLKLYDTYKDNSLVKDSEEFKMLERMIGDQYDSANDKPKDNKEIESTSLQTPVDPESTYRYKYKGNKGYVADIEEAINDGAPMITDWSVHQNVKSDAEIMKEHLESLKDGELNEETKTVEITDGAYYSKELRDLAESKNVELHPTELVGKKSDCGNLSEFKIDEESHEVLECPNGCKPVENSYNEKSKTICAKFDKSKCETCPLKDKCPAYKNAKKTSTLKTTVEKYNNAKQREKQNDKSYQAVSNLRAGVEGLPSLLRRVYNIDHRATKGSFCLKMTLGASIIAINIKRGAKMVKNTLVSILNFIKNTQNLKIRVLGWCKQ